MNSFTSIFNSASLFVAYRQSHEVCKIIATLLVGIHSPFQIYAYFTHFPAYEARLEGKDYGLYGGNSYVQTYCGAILVHGQKFSFNIQLYVILWGRE